MSQRLYWALSAVLTLALVVPGSRAQTPVSQCWRDADETATSDSCKPRSSKRSLTQKSYPVAEMVSGTSKNATDAAETIAQTIIKAVQPESWSEQGGRGTIEYCPCTKTLVVRQTAIAHKQIKSVLKALESVQEQFTSTEAEKNGMSPEEERLQKFWHDYHHALSEYHSILANADWSAYYKNHGRQINASPDGATGRIQYAPVFFSPNMPFGPPPMPMPMPMPPRTVIMGGPFPAPTCVPAVPSQPMKTPQ